MDEASLLPTEDTLNARNLVEAASSNEFPKETWVDDRVNLTQPFEETKKTLHSKEMIANRKITPQKTQQHFQQLGAIAQ